MWLSERGLLQLSLFLSLSSLGFCFIMRILLCDSICRTLCLIIMSPGRVGTGPLFLITLNAGLYIAQCSTNTHGGCLDVHISE